MATYGLNLGHYKHSSCIPCSSRQLNLIPGLSLPIFDSVRLNANLASARAQSNTLIAQYYQSVLNAVREVGESSIAPDGLRQQVSLQEATLQSTGFAYSSAEAHYRRGRVSGPFVFTCRMRMQFGISPCLISPSIANYALVISSVCEFAM